MTLIRIICDGGLKMGFGNLKRSSVLAVELKKNGYSVRLDPLTEEAHHLLPSLHADEGEAALWLLDLPYDGDKWISEARRDNIPVAALDYQGDVAPDLVISVFDRGTAPNCPRHLIGLEYSIIRQEISSLAPAKSGHGAIVIIGGGDADGLGERIALDLHGQGVDVTLIDGPLAKETRRLPRSLPRVHCPSDLPSRMASSQWAVTSGGTTMLELLCLSKPIHVVPRTLHEEALARFVASKGALLGIGMDGLTVPTAHMCSEVSARACTLVDGHGPERIVQAIGTLL
jgi:spore coat polysaccharide biosynthesis predicted glycosyltransferase SpsG